MLNKKEKLFGKDLTDKVVNVEVLGDTAYIFQEDERGVFFHKREFSPWILSPVEDDFYFKKLKGNLHFKYLKKFNNIEEYREKIEQNRHYWTVLNQQESFLLYEGMTYFKNMNFEDLSLMVFDIETSGLLSDENSKLLVISSLYKKNNILEKMIFSLDNYNNEVELIKAWILWVKEKDPSCVLGYNIYNFDFPFLKRIMDRDCEVINLGRNNSNLKRLDFKSKFRMNNGTHFEYHLFKIFGREIIDMYFVAQRYDLDKKYSNYRLKEIAKLEGITKKTRQEYDSSKIGEKWANLKEREKIKKYCMDDTEETYYLYLRMIPSFFEFTKYISLPFSQYINRSSTSQVNNLIIRNYLHEEHSIPNKTFIKEEQLKGGKNIAHHGVYKNAIKIDVSSLYMSIVKTYELYDLKKDPLGIFLFLVENLIKIRLELKEKKKINKKFIEIDRMYKDFLNKGCYGFLATKGYLFNSPFLASEITQRGRNILDKALSLVESKDFVIINADTDSISFCKKDETEITKQDIQNILGEFKNEFIEGINWEIEEYYRKIVSFKSKNYIFLNNENKLVKKGSLFSEKGKEPGIVELENNLIRILFNSENVYSEFLLQYMDILKSIKPNNIEKWAIKKKITDKTFNSKNDNIKKLIKENNLKVGDEINYFYLDNNKIELIDKFKGEFSKKKILNKINKSLLKFEEIVELKEFPFIK